MNKDINEWLHTPLINKTGARQVIFIKNKNDSYIGLIKDSGNRYQSSFIGSTNMMYYIKKFNLNKAEKVDDDLQRWAIDSIFKL